MKVKNSGNMAGCGIFLFFMIILFALAILASITDTPGIYDRYYGE